MVEQIQDWIDTEANKISTSFKVGNRRVKNILKSSLGKASESSFMGRDIYIKYYSELLMEALTNWPKEEALQYFESNPAEWITLQCGLFEYLRRRETPLLSLEELKNNTLQVQKALDVNRDFLVRYGLPKESPIINFWLEIRLIKHYPTRKYGHISFPGSTQILHNFDLDTAKVEWEHIKAYYASKSTDSKLFIPMFPIEQFTNYQSLHLENGLSSDDEQQIEVLRERFLVLKAKILRELYRYLMIGKGQDLLSSGLKLIKEALSGSEIAYLLKLDGFYLGVSPETITEIRDCWDAPGGLSDLIRVIQHYDSELSLGVYAKTRELLGDMVEPYGFSSALKVQSYFLSGGVGASRVLHIGLEEFARLFEAKCELTRRQQETINHFIADIQKEFEADTLISSELKPLHDILKQGLLSGQDTLGMPASLVGLITDFYSKQYVLRETNSQSDCCLSNKNTARLVIEIAPRRAVMDGKTLKLAPTTFKFLVALAMFPNSWQAYEQLGIAIWSESSFKHREDYIAEIQTFKWRLVDKLKKTLGESAKTLISQEGGAYQLNLTAAEVHIDR